MRFPDSLFQAKTNDTGTCILWVGAKDRKGYGILTRKGRLLRAHRYAWEQINGPIAPGLAVCHSCDTPACVNPEHMWLGTQIENLADMRAKGRNSPPPIGARKTSKAILDELERRVANGERVMVVATSLGIHKTTAYRHLKSLP